MKMHLKTIAAAMLFAIPVPALAQTDTHHPPETAAPAEAQMMSPEMMQPMMQMMQDHMGMMMQMMQGMQGMMPMHGTGQDMPMMQGGQDMPMMQGDMMPGGMSEAMAAYMAAMSKMDMPMMQGIQAGDPDVAFVKGMIPHHQGAIDMAKVELQYGDDEQVKAWANQIIAAQEKEIAEMQEWLKAHGE
jgi:uncharacterized protein (DUF305 family)